nr:MAG TPA: hypothetical protein [Caudoviricetes sp.]
MCSFYNNTTLCIPSQYILVCTSLCILHNYLIHLCVFLLLI